MKLALDIIRESLHAIAPEVDFSRIDPDRPLRDQVELDSMDVLNLLARISKECGLRIPASDLDHLRTLRQLEEYLIRHTPPLTDSF